MKGIKHPKNDLTINPSGNPSIHDVIARVDPSRRLFIKGSVGAGALGVAALFFLYPHLPAIRIVGSDIAHAVPLTLVAGTGHWFLGNVDWSLLGAGLVTAERAAGDPQHALRTGARWSRRRSGRGRVGGPRARGGAAREIGGGRFEGRRGGARGRR